MTISDAPSNDSLDILLFPECAAGTLTAKNFDVFDCTNCNAEFQFVDQFGSATLFASKSKTAKKKDIQIWWGNLDKQAYEGLEDRLDGSMMAERMIGLKYLFNQRQMLPVVKIPMTELPRKRILEIGDLFRWLGTRWIGRLTEGWPIFSEIEYPVTRVYFTAQMHNLFGSFDLNRLRKNSFQFNNFCIHKQIQTRNTLYPAFKKRLFRAALCFMGHLTYWKPDWNYFSDDILELDGTS